MPFGSLWIPVVVSAVAVFVASSIVHMVLKYHKADYKALPDEAAAREALGKQKLAPGQYVVPHCADMKEMNDPAMKEKYAKGPVILMQVFPNELPNMGKLLGIWFAFILLVSFTVAYIARHTLTQGAAGMEVLRITGTIAFVGYAYGNFVDSIWRGQPWSNTVRASIDALIYALVTGFTFKLLWP